MKISTSMMVSAVALLSSAPFAGDLEAQTYFSRASTFPVYQNLPEGSDPASETVAEIVSATEDGNMLVYTDSPGEQIGLVDITDPSSPQPAGTVDLGGEPTAVSVLGGFAFAGVNTSESYVEPSGHLAVINLETLEVVQTCDLGGQPDSVAAKNSMVAVAIENERDEDLNDGIIPQAPAGYVSVFAQGEDGLLSDCDEHYQVGFDGLAEIAGDDAEPEFVDINDAGEIVVTLQENNHLVVVDPAANQVVSHFSAGYADLYAVDAIEDGLINPVDVIKQVPREPDAVAWIDDERFVTANEGDYEGGSRSISVFSKDGTLQYDSGNLLDYLAIINGHYPEHRSENKGNEPEGIETGVFGDDQLIFVNSERGNFVAVFKDQGAAREPALLQFLPTPVGPEGVLSLPERNLLVVATEVDDMDDKIRSTLTIFKRDAHFAAYPMIQSRSNPENGQPISWGALSGLTADIEDPSKLYTVSDSAYSVSSIYTVDVSSTPARIIAKTDLVKDDEPGNYDLEGVTQAKDGSFWLASEGNPEKENPLQQKSMLIHVEQDGTVIEEVFLPKEIYENAKRFGFEGLSIFEQNGVENVAVAFQREWGDDPEGMAKIGIYAPAEGSWSFYHYPLEEPKSENGGWVGLSEITHLGEGRFAIIERDNQTGDYAAVKQVAVVDLALADQEGEGIPVLEKTAVIDVLPELQARSGWISDKLEGMAVTADGAVYLVTDNDGVDDASGETLFFKLGQADELF